MTRPFSRKQGFMDAIFSRVVSRRIPWSLSKTISLPSASTPGRGMICSSKYPASWAAAAFRWLSRARRSISSRVTLYFSATFSAVSPLEMYWAGSCSSSQGSMSPLRSRVMGRAVMDSIPPATMQSACPASICQAARATAWREDEQKRSTVRPQAV